MSLVEALEGDCHEDACEEEATTPILWPGKGVLGYCEDHAEKAMGVLENLGRR